MTYPSQPGYPTPQYGGQSPQPQQQNNLWLIGGAVLTVLIVIMTVILLVVQRTHNSDDAGGGGEPNTTAEEGGDSTGDDGGSDGGDDGGDDGGGSGAAELNSEACDAFDFGTFEEAYGPLDPDQTSRTESSTNGLGSLSCSFYNEEVTGVNLRITDYETVEDVVYWVESDADYYNAENGYEFSEWTEMGDAGSFYTDSTDGTKTLNLHVALGSLEITVYTTLWEGEGIDEAAATAALEDFVAQSAELFVDYT
ncbi:hypothetical protein O1R50_21505 [Glycomyces luteolus]|uniref:DUF3558 domain-containing protein n=1 Tax=Glycomyces luteolus TaxID=2670330 RepID=A0A9X3SRY2_9ACTN|nr:hypothetical protein [Glycomyces luteolus]MDA1362217.1 hypothetical protein [Glycomyces luteolus]